MVRHKGTCAALKGTNLCGISLFGKAKLNHREREREKCFKSDGAWQAGKSNYAIHDTTTIHVPSR